MENVVGVPCSTCRGNGKCIKGFGGETSWKENFADLGVDWRINIKMDLEAGQKVVDWINLAQDRDRRWAPVNMDY